VSMVMISTFVGTRGGGAGAERFEQPQISVSAAAARTFTEAVVGDQRVMKRFYCLSCRESGIVLRSP